MADKLNLHWNTGPKNRIRYSMVGSFDYGGSCDSKRNSRHTCELSHNLTMALEMILPKSIFHRL